MAHLAAVGSPEYAALSAMLALLVGALLMFAGVFRAGWIADLLSIPVMTGFLAGISIHIALSQAPGLLGLPVEQGDIFKRMSALAENIHETDATSLVIGLCCLGFILISEKISARIPGALIALAAATAVTWRFDLESKGVADSRAVPSEWPRPAIPVIAPEAFAQVAGLAIVIAVIIMVQTAATSRSFASEGETPDVDGDFLGVGAGSFLAGVFGAFPVDASPPRTAIVSARPAAARRSPAWSPPPSSQQPRFTAARRWRMCRMPRSPAYCSS